MESSSREHRVQHANRFFYTHIAFQVEIEMSARTIEPIRRILLATDFSPSANAAVEYAERLAACTDASLLVLSVRQSWGSGTTSDETDDQMQRTLEEICPRVPGVPVEQLWERMGARAF